MSYEDFAEEEDFSLNSQKEKESRYLRIQRDSILGRRQKIQSVSKYPSSMGGRVRREV